MLLPLLSAGQKEENIWYFGAQAGIDFNSGSAVAITNGALIANEGCSSISDANGGFLFSTNGNLVWNKNQLVMPNGSGLMGHSTSTQSALIVKKPGSNSLYYIFTVDRELGFNGLRYSEVDLSLQSGLGDVTSNKNVLIVLTAGEKLTAIKHQNNVDFWIITHLPNSNTFHSYLLSATGLNMTPVISNIGTNIGNGADQIGHLKANIRGDQIVTVSTGMSLVELFDYDNLTGSISNPITLNINNWPYGAEFSPSGQLLYISQSLPPTSNIYQFNLLAGTQNDIVNSQQVIGAHSGYGGALQLAPNGKIYFSKLSLFANPITTLGVINNPNFIGIGCNYDSTGFSLLGKQTTNGLPNFISSTIIDSTIIIPSDSSIVNVPVKSSLIIPNVFTPNGDKINDEFLIEYYNISSVEGEIYNRWGQKMFEWNRLDKGWDGKSKAGGKVPEGIYLYIIKAQGNDNKEYNEKGVLTLLR